MHFCLFFFYFPPGLIVRFLGEANTSWNETKKVHDSDGREREETIPLTGHEEYFSNSFYLLGAKNGSEIVLPAGEHAYPFTSMLPASLPSSFEGEWGHVRYTIKVTLDRPWKFDQDIKMAFTVLSPLDLNQNARLKVRCFLLHSTEGYGKPRERVKGVQGENPRDLRGESKEKSTTIKNLFHYGNLLLVARIG